MKKSIYLILTMVVLFSMSVYAVQTTFDGTPSTDRNDYLYVSNFSNTNEWLPTASVISNETFLNVSQDNRGSRMISFSIERGMCIDTKATAYPSILEGNFRNVMLKLSNTLAVDEISGTVNTQFGLQDSVGGNEVFIREDVGGGSDTTSLLFTNWSIGVPQNLTLCRNNTGGGAFLIENNRQDINQIMYTTVNSELDHDKLNLTLLSGADGSAIYTHFFIYNLTLGAPQEVLIDPPTISIVTPFNNEITNEDPLLVEYVHSIDTLANLVNITLEVNGTLNQTITQFNNLSINASDGLYDITLTINDDNAGTSSDTVTNVRIDRTNPFSDHAIVLYTGRELINSENTTITFQNSNLSMSNVTILDESGNQLFSEQNNDIHSAIDTIIAQIDAASFGTGTFTIISNVTDVALNRFDVLTTIEILPPTISSQSCDYGSGFVTCSDQVEGTAIEQVRAVCLNGTQSLATLSLNTTPIFTDSLMVKAGDVYTLDNADEVMVINSYNYSVTCSNPADSVSSQTTFFGTLTPAVVDEITALGSGITAFLGVFAFVVILIGLGIKVKSDLRGNKK